MLNAGSDKIFEIEQNLHFSTRFFWLENYISLVLASPLSELLLEQCGFLLNPIKGRRKEKTQNKYKNIYFKVMVGALEPKA